MFHRVVILLLTTLFLFFLNSCDDNSTEVDSNIPIYLQNFYNITEVDNNGNIIGSADLDDWKLYIGESGYNNFRNGIDSNLVVTEYVHISPVYPNPATDSINFNFMLSVSDTINMIFLLIDEDGNKIKEIFNNTVYNAGSHSFTFYDLPNENKLYRCLYEFRTSSDMYWGYGDIRVR